MVSDVPLIVLISVSSPSIVSSPAPANIVSFPAPPSTKSFPANSLSVSSPAKPLRVLSLLLPVIWSELPPKLLPVIFSIDSKVSVPIFEPTANEFDIFAEINELDVL